MSNLKLKDSFNESGQAIIAAVLFFSLAAMTMVFGAFGPVVRNLEIGNDLLRSKQSYFTAEAGSEDAYYRIKNNLATSFPEILVVGGATSTVTVSVTGSNEQDILSVGDSRNLIRSVVKNITVTDGFAFNFAVQVGLGGLLLKNDSDVIGNVYSNGTIVGDNRTSNFILGDAVSAGSSGSISKIHATSSAYARNISDSIIDRDAYYQTIDAGTTVGGVKFPGSSDQPPVAMPIADSLLDQWEGTAAAGGVINSPCPYKIDSSVTLGPIKINCGLEVSKDGIVVTLAGTVWVNGDIDIKNKPKFKVSDSLGNKSVPIIAHSSSDPSGKGIVNIDNEPTFWASESGGVANPDSYVMLVSRNTSAESGGSLKAITAGNHVSGNLLLYAPRGKVELSNHVMLREVTGYQLTLKNDTEVRYNIGLAQPLFVAGPGGQWKIKRWRETK